MKNGIYKVKPWGEMDAHVSGIGVGDKTGLTIWTIFMERNCPKSRNIRIRDDKWNISGEEFPVCPEMFEDGPI